MTRMKIVRALALVPAVALLGSVLVSASDSPGAAAASTKAPILGILDRFTAPGVPAMGEKEIAVRPRKPIEPTTMNVAELPGNGLARHPMVYIGEGDNTIYLIDQGKVVWTYQTGLGNELDDVWLMTNGNLLFSRMSYVEIVTPDKKVVWHRDAPAGTEIHTCQPLGFDKVMLVENGTPARLLVIDIKTNKVEVEHEIPDAGPVVHPQFRRARVTAAGTYLLPFLEMNKVVEYDKHFKPIWTYEIPSPWAAIRLRNGNTLITDEKDRLAREVNRKGETVWEYSLKTDLPAGLVMPGSQSNVRLANGNTVICSRGGNGAGLQLIEVTPDKKVVWALYDWKTLGPATAVQMLDDPCIPEKPGDCQR
jgi:Mal s 1 allergenic protein-like